MGRDLRLEHDTSINWKDNFLMACAFVLSASSMHAGVPVHTVVFNVSYVISSLANTTMWLLPIKPICVKIRNDAGKEFMLV